MSETYRYHATPSYLDPTWLAGLVQTVLSFLTMPTNVQVIPLEYLPYITFVGGLILTILREVSAKRPVSLNLAPGETKVVHVARAEGEEKK